MMQVEVSSPYKTIEFNPLKELSELRAAVSGASEADKKLSWYKNAKEDLKHLENDFVITPKFDKKSEEIKPSKNGIVILGSSNNSSSAEYQFTPVTSKKASKGNTRWDEFEGKVAKAKLNASYLTYLDSDYVKSQDVQYQRDLRELMEKVRANEGRIPDGYDAFPWLNGWVGDENKDRQYPDNVINLVEERAKRSRLSEILRSRSAGQVGQVPAPGWFTWRRAIIGAAGIGLVSLVGVASIWGPGLVSSITGGGGQEPVPGVAPIPEADGKRFIKIKFSEADPDYKDYHNGNIAALRGQMAQGYFEHTSMDKNTPYELLDKADKKSIEQGMNVFRGDNKPTYLSVGGAINDEMLVTRDGQGQVIEFNWRNNLVEYYGQVEPKPVSTPTPEPAQAEPQAEAAPAPEATAVSRREQQRESSRRTDASRQESFMCADGVKSKADAENKVKKDQCLYSKMLGAGFDLNKPFDSVSYIPLSQAGFDLNTEYQMFYKEGNIVKNDLIFTFTDGRATNLRIGDKFVNINQHKVAKFVQDGKVAIMLDWCGNLIFGFEEIKETPAPTQTPTTTSAATVIEVKPTSTPEPTRVPATQTPVPPPAQYVPPAPPPQELIPQQPIPPGEGVILKICDNRQAGIPRELDSTDFACDANFRVEFLDPTGNHVLHVLDNVRTTGGIAKITSPQPGMIFRAIERLDLLPAQLNLVRDDIYGRTVPQGANIDLRSGNIDFAWALNGPDVLPPPPPPPPPVEGRFPVCLDIFGRTENLTLYELRQRVAGLNLGIGNVDFLSVPQLQEILNRRCVISVTSTGTPFVIFNPTQTPESQRTSTPTIPPTPDMTPTRPLQTPTTAPFQSPTEIPSTPTPRLVTATPEQPKTPTPKIVTATPVFNTPTTAPFQQPSQIPATPTVKFVTPTSAAFKP